MGNALLFGLLLSTAACGGTVSSPSPGSTPPSADAGDGVVIGTVGDAGVSSNSAFAILSEITNTGKPSGQVIGITFTSRVDWTCGQALAAAAAFEQLANTQAFDFGVENGSGPLGPGTFSLTAGQAYGQIVTTDATCDVTQVFATSGSITLTGIGTDVTGSYDLTFSTHGSLSGTFSVPVCDNSTPIGPPSPPPPGPPICLQ